MPSFIFNTPNGRKTIKIPRWAMIATGVAMAGLGVLLLLVAASLALVIVPLAFIVVGIAGWNARRQFNSQGQKKSSRSKGQGAAAKAGVGGMDMSKADMNREPKRPGQGAEIIEGDYKILEPRKERL